MTHFTELTRLDNAIRRALLADSFEETRELLARYGAEVERLLVGSPCPGDVSQIERQTRALFGWMTLVAYSSRARLDARRANLRRVCRYRAASAWPRLHRFQARSSGW
jgi:hypothetical protein